MEKMSEMSPVCYLLGMKILVIRTKVCFTPNVGHTKAHPNDDMFLGHSNLTLTWIVGSKFDIIYTRSGARFARPTLCLVTIVVVM